MIGTITGALTLIPTLLAILNGQLPAGRESSGYIGWSLVHIYPAFKGIVYWFTLGALDMVRPLKETIFLSEQFLSLHGKWNFMSISIYILQIVCVLTVFVSVYASWWWFWKSRKFVYGSDEKTGWLRQYTTGGAICLFISAALSPIVLQGWQVVLMLHTAVLPVILWVEHVFLHSEDKPKRWVWVGIYTAVEVLLVLVLAQGLYIFSNPGIVPEAVQHNQELLEILHLP
jgi:hypothetical protein